MEEREQSNLLWGTLWTSPGRGQQCLAHGQGCASWVKLPGLKPNCRSERIELSRRWRSSFLCTIRSSGFEGMERREIRR